MNWPKSGLYLPDGSRHEASAPLILSASRATDLPAWHCDWFLDRLQAGWCEWTNPFNGRVSLIDLRQARCIVFWTKNAAPLLEKLAAFDRLGIQYYVQFTLNDFGDSRLEPDLPPLAERLGCFRSLSDKLGPARVVWRFDPLILGDRLTVSGLLNRVESLAGQLKGYTEKLVFSFVDIAGYRAVSRRLSATPAASYRQFNNEEMQALAAGLAGRLSHLGLRLATCAEKVDLGTYGIEHNSCIDPALIRRLAAADPILTDFIDRLQERGRLKDKGQRPACRCLPAKDIGRYNSCRYSCTYCYARNRQNFTISP